MAVDVASLLLFLLIGAVAGWLAGLLMRGYGFGLIANILIGIVGALVGGFLFDAAGVGTEGGILWTLLVALVGAIALLFVAGLLGRIVGTRA